MVVAPAFALAVLIMVRVVVVAVVHPMQEGAAPVVIQELVDLVVIQELAAEAVAVITIHLLMVPEEAVE